MKGMYGMDGRVTYRRLVEGDRDAVAAIFVEAYYNQLRGLDPDRAGLEAMFRGAFLLDHFTGAFDGDELVGFFALSTEAERSVAVRKDDVYARMRGVKRWFAYAALRKEFGHPVRLREPGYYLECVAVKPSRQGEDRELRLPRARRPRYQSQGLRHLREAHIHVPYEALLRRGPGGSNGPTYRRHRRVERL